MTNIDTQETDYSVCTSCYSSKFTGVSRVLSVVSGAFYFRFECKLLFEMAYHILTVPKLKAELIIKGGGTKKRKPDLVDW